MSLGGRSRAGSAPPAIDDRLVAPETRYEMHDGELVHVSPADPPERDPAQLSRWLARALRCTEISQIFVDE